MRYKKILKSFDLFKNVQSSTIDKILEKSEVIEYSRGSEIMRIKKKVEYVYIQLTGKSIEYNLTYNGRRKIIFVNGVGSLLNGHIINQVPSSAYFETIEKSSMLVVRIDDFIECMKSDFELIKNVMSYQERKIWRLKHQLKNTASDISVEKRLLSKLLKLGRDFGKNSENGREIDMDLSVTFLSDMLGVPRETASRACSKLIHDGLIVKKNKRITLLNPEYIVSVFMSEKDKTLK